MDVYLYCKAKYLVLLFCTTKSTEESKQVITEMRQVKPLGFLNNKIQLMF